MRAVHIIGVPLDLGGNRRGTDMGPSAFRIAGIGEQLTALGLAVTDKGDIASPIPELKGPGDSKKRYVREIAKVCQRLFQASLASFDEGALPIALGGDHSLGAGSVAAAAVHVRKRGKALGLIWVDAHGDMNGPLVHHLGQCARHAAGRAAGPRAGGAAVGRRGAGRARQAHVRRSSTLFKRVK